jgi:hypothetical protein
MTSPRAVRFTSLLLQSLIGLGLAGSALAQSSSGAQGLLDDKWVLNLGAFMFGTSVKAGLDGQSSSNPAIDFDDTFGKANDATRVRADVLWRITPVHRMRFMYFDNSVTRTRVLAEDLKWGDYTFGAGSHAELKNSFKTYELAYEYAFVRQPTYEVAASAGLHLMDFKIQLSGTATVTDGQGHTSEASASTKASSLPAPLPVVGLRAGWVVAPNWYIDAQGQFFKIKVGDYDGRWSDLRVGATWMFHRNYGLGLGYNRFTSKLDVNKSDFNGRLDLGYSGVQAFLTGTF